MSDDEIVEPWKCGDCGHTETGVPIDELAGERVTKTVGSGRREKEIETVICPECGSDDWHSKSIGEALLGRGDYPDAEYDK